ncbi:sugar ABC transporter substrate-binding protein [Kribbella sp. NPDC000426]|uniref:ABC transporter substrate-binding protein n=1 Tax=Kribbella sp. NPDC000426 TaxID=3154255 RepID=UPI003331F66F
MNTARRLLSLCLAPLLLAAAACSGSSESADNEHVTLTYAIWDQAQSAAMKQIIDEFHAQHPNIDVQVQVTPWESYWTKLQTSITAGSGPDVLWMTMVYAKYYAVGGGIAPLDDQIKDSKLDMGAYVPAVTKAYTVDGKVYGIPKDVNGFGLCYNKLLFDAAKVKYPDESWTWNDVIAAAQKLTNPQKGVFGFVAPEADELSWYLTVPQVGGQIISADGKSSGYGQPATVQGIQFWTDMITKYHVSPTLQQTTDTDPLAMLTSGKVAMRYCGSWEPEEIAAVPYGKANIDVAPLPAGPDGNRKYYSNGLANSISAKTKHPKQAWEFAQFLGSERAAEIQAKTGTVIPAYQGHADAYAKAMPEFHLQVFVDHLKYAEPFPASTDTAAWRDAATKQFADAWTGKASTADVSQRVAETMNEALAKEKK